MAEGARLTKLNCGGIFEKEVTVMGGVGLHEKQGRGKEGSYRNESRLEH